MQNHSFFLTLFRISKLTFFALSLMLFGFSSIALAAEPTSVADIPTRLIIPGISLDSEIIPIGFKTVEVGGRTAIQYLVDNHRVGWHKRSAKLGQVGNTVLNGHSDVYGKIFKDLHKVKPGDELTILSNKQVYRYVITQKVIVQENGVSVEERIKNVQWIAPTEDERLTMVTCIYPGSTHRLIVIAHPVGR